MASGGIGFGNVELEVGGSEVQGLMVSWCYSPKVEVL